MNKHEGLKEEYIEQFNVPNGKGIYSLILELKKDTDITVGALGPLTFLEGYYSYTGSARGIGGFSRVERHLKIASGQKNTRRWHIDYLLPFTHPLTVVLTCTGQDLECVIAGTIASRTRTILGFGCSDCKCSGHLHWNENVDELISIVKDAHNNQC
ncbi:MAG: GIY-YIG nuclease family protein [Methanosarcinales archaeon]|nr:GIY-YIG nuclease family protein [Methanosarcinales archaeon]